MAGRRSDTMALAGLLGRGALGWDALLADARRDAAQVRLAGVPVADADAAATSGANDAGYVRVEGVA